jgi:hypothetical protein
MSAVPISLRTRGGIEPFLGVRRLLKQKMLYTVSPVLFPRPEFRPAKVQVMGYHVISISCNWSPVETLLEYLEVPAIIKTASGGIKKEEDLKDYLYDLLMDGND